MAKTIEEIEKIVLAHADDCNDYEGVSEEDYEWAHDNVKLVEEGVDIIEHKTVHQTSIYSADVEGVTRYFEVTFFRDNTGYWSDGESYPPEIIEVVHEQVVMTMWRAV